MGKAIDTGLAIVGLVQDAKRAKQAHEEFRDLRNAREKLIKSSAPIRDRLFTDIESAQRGELTGAARTRADEAIIQARAAGSRSEQQLRDQLARQGITGSFAQQALSEHRQRVEEQIASIEPGIIAELAGLAPGVGLGTVGAAQGFSTQGLLPDPISGQVLGALLSGQGQGTIGQGAAELGSEGLTNLLGALRSTTKIAGGSRPNKQNWGFLESDFGGAGNALSGRSGDITGTPSNLGLGSNW